jgi:hypothetical protein
MYIAPHRSGLGKLGLIFFELLHLIAGRMRQRFLMVEHCAEIAHIEPAAARFAFPKMFGLAHWRSAGSLAYHPPARDDRRHACDLGHFCRRTGQKTSRRPPSLTAAISLCNSAGELTVISVASFFFISARLH